MYYSLFYYKIYKKWKIQRGGRRRTNLNNPKNYNIEKKILKTILKTPPKLLPLVLWKSQGIYRRKGAPGYVYRAACQITTRGSKPLPWKCSFCRIFAAVLAPRTRLRLLRAPRLSPCRLYFLESRFGPPVLTKQPSKVNGYSCSLLITN